MSLLNRPVRRIAAWVATGVIVGASVLLTAQQAPPQFTSMQRAHARQMLRTAANAIKNEYYDPAFHGIDLQKHFKIAEARIESATSQSAAWAVIAQALVEFDDSHTFFMPPENPSIVEYGWQMGMVGDECLVLGVRPGSDAEAKGLRAGDRVVAIENVQPTRKHLWKLRYSLSMLNPRRRVRVVAQTGDAAPRQLDIDANVTQRRAEVRVDIEHLIEGLPTDFDEYSVKRTNRSTRLGDIAVWRIAAFDFNPDQVDRLVDDAVKGATSLVIDLRGNPGGLVKTLEQFTGRLFERDVKIADLKTRKSSKASVAKKRKTPFTGQIVILVDSESASAAEVLARVLQIEKRGIVVGDRTSGAVMVGAMMMDAIELPSGSEELRLIPYGFSVTVADMIMTDGKSLERVGVTPDELLLPSPADLAASRDPVLSRAISLLGGTLDPVAAGKVFPIEWK